MYENRKPATDTVMKSRYKTNNIRVSYCYTTVTQKGLIHVHFRHLVAKVNFLKIIYQTYYDVKKQDRLLVTSVV
jgi:hypothetical protein